MGQPRRLAHDWYPGTLPANVLIDETAYIETTFSFHLYRSEAPVGLRMDQGASVYLGTMFDVGPQGQVHLGPYALVHGARIVCDAAVEIGDYALISWNVVLMDSYRLPSERAKRRQALQRLAQRWPRRLDADVRADPIRIGRNVWIGFETCVLPGISIGEGAVVAARSVVSENVPPYALVGGNPARVIRFLETEANDAL